MDGHDFELGPFIVQQADHCAGGAEGLGGLAHDLLEHELALE
jgi:hypothetical protein